MIYPAAEKTLEANLRNNNFISILIKIYLLGFKLLIEGFLGQ